MSPTAVHRSRRRNRLAAVAAAVAVVAGGLLAGPVTAEAAAPATVQAGPAVTALSPELEAIRVAEAKQLYGGDGAVKPMDQRKTGLIALGDSEMSGEGAGDYIAPTDGPDNWCHRSANQMIHKTGIPSDVTYNVACSGAATYNIRIGGSKQYADELVQSDSLAIKARNTKLKLVTVFIGANDDIEFGPTMSDCVERRVFFKGECYQDYAGGWQARADAIVPKVTQTLLDLKKVMRDAGYADSDYKLVSMSYPSPISPDVEDNPNFPGWYGGGCLGYLRDAAWGRNAAVPTFEKAERQAAANAGVTYLDNSRLFMGHEVCQDNTWARGLYFANLDLFDENTTRQSFHPNSRGHDAFASCLTQLYNSGLAAASCADVNSSAQPKLIPGVLSAAFKQFKNDGTGMCADTYGFSSRNGTRLDLWPCQGFRNQGFWYDGATKTLHSELSQDRCVDVMGGNTTGSQIGLWDCHGGVNQQWTQNNGTLRPVGAPTLCLAPSGSDPTIGAFLTLAACDGSANQRFTQSTGAATQFTELKSGGTGLCFDVTGNSPSNGQTVGTWTCDGSADQKWWRNPATGQVHNLADPNYCLDNRGSTTAGAQLGTWFCADGTGASRDNLRFNQAADGKLTSRVSGLAVTAPTGGTGLLSQQSVNSSAAQKWNAGAAGKLSNGPIPYDAY